MPTISEELIPALGSEAVNMLSGDGILLLDATSLNSLAHGGTSSSFSYLNPTGASNCRVIIILEKINVTTGGGIQIDNGTNYYQLMVPTGNSSKRIEFLNIPASFLSSFVINNETGVALAASGNSITIVPED